MADSDDASERTEEPTQKRIDDAREKGQVLKSQEMNHWFAILAATIIVAAFLPGIGNELALQMTVFFDRPHTLALDPASLQVLFADMLRLGGSLVLLPLAMMALAAVASAMVQHGWLVSTESLEPKLSKISPLGGAKRLFSQKAILDLVKGVLKLVVVGAVATVLLIPMFRSIDVLAGTEMGAVLVLLQQATVRIMLGVLVTMTIIAVLDWLYQRFDLMKELRMSRQDLKEEFKQSEGDPTIKQRLRQLRQERSRKRMMAAVPTADVVIANPTHFAVALKYDQKTMAAPRCVAKGTDLLALKIREVAAEAGVTVVENPPLARALHAAVEIDADVPVEHYRAVAEVIGYVWRLKGRAGR